MEHEENTKRVYIFRLNVSTGACETAVTARTRECGKLRHGKNVSSMVEKDYLQELHKAGMST